MAPLLIGPVHLPCSERNPVIHRIHGAVIDHMVGLASFLELAGGKHKHSLDKTIVDTKIEKRPRTVRGQCEMGSVKSDVIAAVKKLLLWDSAHNYLSGGINRQIPTAQPVWITRYVVEFILLDVKKRNLTSYSRQHYDFIVFEIHHRHTPLHLHPFPVLDGKLVVGDVEEEKASVIGHAFRRKIVPAARMDELRATRMVAIPRAVRNGADGVESNFLALFGLDLSNLDRISNLDKHLHLKYTHGG